MTDIGLSGKTSILIVQPTLVHYRKSLFERLSESEKYNIKIIGGSHKDAIEGIKESNPKIQTCLVNKKIRIAGHSFIWQSGLLKLIKKTRPDIVVLTGVDPHLIVSLILTIFKTSFKIKIIWWGHATIDKQGRWGKKIRKYFFNRADGIMTYGTENSLKLKEVLDNKIPIVSVKNCINDEEYGFNQKGSGTSDGVSHPFTVLFSGRLTFEKRVDLLVRAIEVIRKKNVEIKCVIVGAGPEFNDALRLANELNVADYIEFAGAKYQAECIPYFQEADIFVLPGKVGLSIIHGMSYGLPVITSDKKEIHSPEFEIITKGSNGDFFSDFDYKSLAEKILEWKTKLENNRKEIREECVRSVTDEGFTVDSMSEKMIRFFGVIGND